MNQTQVNPFDEENQAFYVLMNRQLQYSLWPVFAAQPAGWRQVYGPELRAACIAYIDKHWQDMRPLALQQAGR